MDDKRGLIRICDLSRAQIEPGRVGAALEFWQAHRSATLLNQGRSGLFGDLVHADDRLLPPGAD
jgi:hypothetical protein